MCQDKYAHNALRCTRESLSVKCLQVCHFSIETQYLASLFILIFILGQLVFMLLPKKVKIIEKKRLNK